LYKVAFATPAQVATCDMLNFVPLVATACRAPSSSAARVRFIELPARVRVPVTRTGAADAMAGASAVERNSVSASGSRALMP
jgi:hypothetical protein